MKLFYDDKFVDATFVTSDTPAGMTPAEYGSLLLAQDKQAVRMDALKRLGIGAGAGAVIGFAARGRTGPTLPLVAAALAPFVVKQFFAVPAQKEGEARINVAIMTAGALAACWLLVRNSKK